MLTIAGIGPGNPKYLTGEVLQEIKDAKAIVGFGRVAKSLEGIREDITQVNKVDEVIALLEENKEILLLASGDPNFYGIVEFIKRKGIEVTRVLPGISSFQYLMSKLEIPWQEAKFISLHGRNGDLKEVMGSKLSIILIDRGNNASFISKELKRLGLNGFIYVGFNLSYEDEKIIKINIGEDIEDISPLGVVVIENEMD